MELNRKPFQGVLNIVRFNWHFYLLANIGFVFILFLRPHLPEQLQGYLMGLTVLSILSIVISLFVSYYIYDVSNLYEFHWLSDFDGERILNVNAGFDEVSRILQHKFSFAQVTICDFYNPQKHTELSIQRARNAYPPVEGTLEVTTDALPFPDNYFDCILIVLSAHEIRDQKERIQFFKEIRRVVRKEGRVYVTEHLRDPYNFLVYTVGCFHFYSKANWLKTFTQADFNLKKRVKTSPFITTFALEKNVDTF